MSNVSNRHNVNPFTAGKSVPLTGQRLAKIGYKKTAKQTNPLPSICVSVPWIEIDLSVEAYQPAFRRILVDALSAAQDGIIRSLYESSGGTLTSVGDSEISLASCLAFLESEANEGRLTKESILVWFESHLRDSLTVTIADKLGFTELTPENESVISRHVKGYADLFASLAGGKTVLETQQINSLKRALELQAEDTEIGGKLLRRLEEMSRKEKIEDLLEL